MENEAVYSKSIFDFDTYSTNDFQKLRYIYKFIAVNQFISSIDLKTNIYFPAK